MALFVHAYGSFVTLLWIHSGDIHSLNLSSRQISCEGWRQMLIIRRFWWNIWLFYVFVWLFCAYIWLFCGLFVEEGGVRCWLHGVFGGNIWLFYGVVWLICKYIWLFCGLFVEEGGVRCGLYGVFCGYTWLLQYQKIARNFEFHYHFYSVYPTGFRHHSDGR